MFPQAGWGASSASCQWNYLVSHQSVLQPYFNSLAVISWFPESNEANVRMGRETIFTWPTQCLQKRLPVEIFPLLMLWGLSGGSVVRNLPANIGDARDTGLISGLDPLEKEMATHSKILAWEIPWIEEPGRYNPWGHSGYNPWGHRVADW